MSTETVSATSNPLDAVKHAAGSDIGLRREENQDSFGIIESQNFKLYIVADGMGGVKGGGIASNLAINVLKECLEDKSELNQSAVTAAVEHANTEIFEKGTGDPALAGMGTTYVGLGFIGDKMLISSVGDSRAYRVRDNNIQQLTVDHTLVMELLRSGAISAEQADNHPVSHMLTRSLGPAPTVEVDCWICEDGPARGDIYIMCSDGLYNLVQSHEMASIVQDNYIEVAVQKLIKLANERGGTDNITVIVVEISDEFPVGPEAFESAPTPEPVEEEEEVAEAATGADDETEASSDDNLVHDQDVTPISMKNGKHDTNGAHPEQPKEAEKDLATGKPSSRSFEKKSPKLQAKVDIATAQSNQEKVKAAEAEAQAAAQAEQASAEAATTAAQNASDEGAAHFSRSMLLGGAFLLTLISFVGGFFATRLTGGSGAGSREDVLAPVQMQAQIARFDAEVGGTTVQPRTLSPALRVGVAEMNSPVQQDTSVNDRDNGHDAPLTMDDSARVLRRKAVLRDLLGDLQEKIGAFEKPLNAKLLDQLKDARTKREGLEGQEDDLRAQIDVATRRLAVWYGRRKRLQSTDPINLATEVAVASPSVKDKKEVFELATWSYLKEAEVLRYNPSDESQQKKVYDLARVRKDRQKELGDEVRRAIDKEVSDSDRAIAELTLRRDRLLVEVENIRRSEEYVKVLMGSDSKAKESKRRELERERDVAATELEELNHMVPDPVPQVDTAAQAPVADAGPQAQIGSESAKADAGSAQN